MDTESKTVIGVKYKDNNDDGKLVDLYGSAVILTAGGFGNDHTDTSLLRKYGRTGEATLPTTNGGWATGDGVKMGSKIGAKLVDMSEIQSMRMLHFYVTFIVIITSLPLYTVHPTGFINPKARDDKTKFLAPEALRGLGGIVVNAKGQRFVNELDLRAKVVEKMRAQQKDKSNLPFRLLMNDVVKDAFGPNMNFYIKFGLVKEYDNVGALAHDTGMSGEIIESMMKRYVQDAKKGKDKFGKTVFPNGESYDVNEKIYAAEITPVIHYTMGGLSINNKAQILDRNDDIINGFYGAGEVTGGVHGKNRLAGNSLLECVVYGRIAARNVIEYCENVNKQKEIHHKEL